MARPVHGYGYGYCRQKPLNAAVVPVRPVEGAPHAARTHACDITMIIGAVGYRANGGPAGTQRTVL